MTFDQYLIDFEQILAAPKPPAPYDEEMYFQYTKLNWTRLQRWLKHAIITDETIEVISKIQTPQKWILITEPWCGDAAHIVPIIQLISRMNTYIDLSLEYRDQAPHRIEHYLTNGGKSIPILIMQDSDGSDLATWGPRPKACQTLFNALKEQDADFDTIKEALQKWYNSDKSISIQKEIASLLQSSQK